jgi:hypothetical protein
MILVDRNMGPKKKKKNDLVRTRFVDYHQRMKGINTQHVKKPSIIGSTFLSITIPRSKVNFD